MNRLDHKKIKSFIVMVAALCPLIGCASFSIVSQTSADQTAQEFFDDLKKTDEGGAYSLFSEQLAQKISSDQFAQFIESLESQWGKLQNDESVILPFHQRTGESDLIPPNVSKEEIKRYVFDVKFDNASVNCGLTLIPEGNQYKIAWFSFWGSDVYMKSDIRQKMDELFHLSTK